MRRRISILVVLLIAAMLTTIGGVSAQGEADSTEIGKVIRAFMNADASGATVMVNDPGPPLSPFGGESQLSPDVLAPVTIVETMDFDLNPLPFSTFAPDGVDVVLGQPGDNGTIQLVDLGLTLPQQFPPPFQPGGAVEVEDLFGAILDTTVPSGFLNDFTDGVPIEVDGVVVLPPAGGGPPNFFEPLAMRAFRTAAPFPNGGCNGNIIEVFTGDALDGDPTWVPADFAPNDIFRDLSQAHVARCMNGAFQPVELLRNNGSGFPPAPTNAFGIIGEQGGAFFIPHSEIEGSDVWRTGAFTTPSSGGYQPHNTGFTTAPPFSGLAPTADVFFVNNPFPGHMLHPTGLHFAEADDGSSPWQGNFVQAFDEDEETSSIQEFNVHMFQVDSLQWAIGPMIYNPDAGTAEGMLEGSTVDHHEIYHVPTGLYTFTANGSTSNYPMTTEGGENAGLIAQFATVYDERFLAANPPPSSSSSSSSSSSTLAATSGSTTPEVIDAGASEGKSIDGGSSSPLIWIFILLILAIIAAFVWWFFFGKPKDDPCKEKYAAWQKAKAACDEATRNAKQKRTDADKAETKREDAEKAREDHCKAYPPACGPQSSATDVDSGRTVTRDDLHVQRQWARSAWAAYGAGTQTAAETEAQWKSPPTEKFRNDALKELNDAKTKTPDLDKAINDTKTAEANANAEADQAEKDAKKACDDAAAAKKAYDECVKTRDGDVAAADSAAASAAGAAVGGVGGAAVAGAGGAAKVAGGKDCSAEQQAYDAAKKACDEAEEASNAAAKKAAEAEKALEDLCEEYPPLCHDGDWAEEAGKPETRVTTRDLFVRDLWAEHAWSDYEMGDVSAQELSDRWSQDPTEDFARDQLRKLEDAKPLHAARTQAVKDTKAKADETRKAADTACAKVDPAKRALDTCLAAAGG